MDIVQPDFDFGPFIWLAILVELILKGIALWKCGRNNQLGWYIAIFLISSIGILPLIYLLGFQKNKDEKGNL